jgi:hypothetical protein
VLLKKASEYRQHAKECRDLARGMEHNEQRKQLMDMAEMWDRLAIDRAALIERHPELAKPGEAEEHGNV